MWSKDPPVPSAASSCSMRETTQSNLPLVLADLGQRHRRSAAGTGIIERSWFVRGRDADGSLERPLFLERPHARTVAKDDLVVLVHVEIGSRCRDTHGQVIEHPAMDHANRLDASNHEILHDIAAPFAR